MTQVFENLDDLRDFYKAKRDDLVGQNLVHPVLYDHSSGLVGVDNPSGWVDWYRYNVNSGAYIKCGETLTLEGKCTLMPEPEEV